jgi:hypothetical protein
MRSIKFGTSLLPSMGGRPVFWGGRRHYFFFLLTPFLGWLYAGFFVAKTTHLLSECQGWLGMMPVGAMFHSRRRSSGSQLPSCTCTWHPPTKTHRAGYRLSSHRTWQRYALTHKARPIRMAVKTQNKTQPVAVSS